MIKGIREQKIDTIFVLIIFCVFAVSVLMVLMLGASVYRNMTEITSDGSDERTTLAYIWSKVKNSDDAQSIETGEFQGLSALYIYEEYDSVKYHTIVYYYNGWVYELFSEAELEFYPEDGIKIIKVDGLTFEDFQHGLIKVTAGRSSLLVSPRGTVVRMTVSEGRVTR